MPTITPATGPQDTRSQAVSTRPRQTVNASTRDDISPKPKADAQGNPVQPGQGTISEETRAQQPARQAVTLSPQLTALARKQQRFEQEKTAFEARKGDFVPKSDILAKIKGGKASEALKDLGLTYDEIATAVLAEQTGADPIAALTQQVQDLKKAQDDNVTKQFEATLKQYKREADALVAQDPKAFHFLSKGKAAKEWGDECPVTQLILDTWEANPDEVLTVQQAAKEVEEILRAEAKAMADTLNELNPPAPAAEVPAQNPAKKTLPPPQTAQRPVQRTLTQQAEAGAPPARTPGQMQHLSMRDRIAEAVRRAQRTG